MFRQLTALAVLALAILAGCQADAQAPQPKPSAMALAERIQEVRGIRKEVKEYAQNVLEHAAICRQVEDASRPREEALDDAIWSAIRAKETQLHYDLLAVKLAFYETLRQDVRECSDFGVSSNPAES